MDSSEIPEAIKEYWPTLRLYIDQKMLSMASDMKSEGIDFRDIGIACSCCTDLLDSIGSEFISIPQKPSQKTRPRLSNHGPRKQS